MVGDGIFDVRLNGGGVSYMTNTFILLTRSFLVITINMNVGWAVDDEESVIVEKKIT